MRMSVCAGARNVRQREPGHAVEQRVRGAGAATAREPVRGGRVDAPVGRAQLQPGRAAKARRRARQAARQPALLPGKRAAARPARGEPVQSV